MTHHGITLEIINCTAQPSAKPFPLEVLSVVYLLSHLGQIIMCYPSEKDCLLLHETSSTRSFFFLKNLQKLDIILSLFWLVFFWSPGVLPKHLVHNLSVSCWEYDEFFIPWCFSSLTRCLFKKSTFARLEDVSLGQGCLSWPMWNKVGNKVGNKEPE